MTSTDFSVQQQRFWKNWNARHREHARFGRTTGTDLSNEVLARASARGPMVEFIAGDFMIGHLMLATQNRPVLERYNNIPPPAPGQLRRWVNKKELKALLLPEFEVHEVFSVTPKASRGLMRIINSHKLNAPIRAVVGDHFERWKEKRGLGWTLMALATRRATAMKPRAVELSTTDREEA